MRSAADTIRLLIVWFTPRTKRASCPNSLRKQRFVDNVREELDEVLEAMADNDSAAITEEVGDLLFAAVNLARHLKVDPENALRAANAKFERRFRFIEQALRDTRRPIEDCSLEEMDALWGEAKRQEKITPNCG